MKPGKFLKFRQIMWMTCNVLARGIIDRFTEAATDWTVRYKPELQFSAQHFYWYFLYKCLITSGKTFYGLL
ncbi:hypothetical protein C5975_19385 [Cronobacter sakazakii]|nr:hypothetical protein C5934_13235 [Cronobacter sakazakii]PQX71785.1 hypothetical protein C5975_19385 [Cronobacter sakazakii]PQY60373.1 hypothetical protein C5954_02470 [Cronobacter sakazakii]